MLGGEIPEISLLREHEFVIYASDGGANILFEAGIRPDYIIGDMDSINRSYLEKFVFPEDKMIPSNDQETNDFEKSIHFIMNQGVRNIAVFGFSGGDVEHTLNNWSVLLKHSPELGMFIVNGGRMGFCVSDSCRVVSLPGEKISLLPAGETYLSTNGLKWDLEREYLILGGREGLSNLALKSHFEVILHKGGLTIFKDSVFPNFFKVVKR